MNKLEIGMYVRTKQGKIYKIINNDYLQSTIFRQTNEEIDEPYKVLKASHNIIDLIEVGDYVNGVEVIDKEFDNFNEEYVQCGVGDYVICTYEEKEIETIVTKEAFKSMEYRLGDK